MLSYYSTARMKFLKKEKDKHFRHDSTELRRNRSELLKHLRDKIKNIKNTEEIEEEHRGNMKKTAVVQ
jgi:predicted ATP-binding protein involved in virulence